jgi:hypothetical protein
MELTFIYPWFAFAAALLAVAGGVMAFWKRRNAPMLFMLGAAAFLVAGARPQVGTRAAEVRHALVVDVSGSMSTRAEAAALADSLELPAGHSFVRYELSDAVRIAGSARGEGTDYARLADIAADASINGEIVMVTDGRGRLEELYSAVDPRRLILLRAPAPGSPDATVLTMTAPTSVPKGTAAMLRGTVRCDAAASVPWRLLDGSTELAAGEVALRADVPAAIELAQPLQGEGLRRLTLVLDLPGDRESRNDQASVAVAVGSQRRVEYCAARGVPPESDGLLQLLKADAGNVVNVRHSLPTTQADLNAAALVVINNLSLAESGTTREQLDVLADWARSGGNLLMVGTNGAFGPGGYRGTAIEEVMPVRFRPDDAPPRRVLLLLDTSASMDETLSGGEKRLDRLKEGVRRVLTALDESDQAAVLGFRESVQGEASFLAARDERLLARVNALAAGGTTRIATSLDQALDVSTAPGTRIMMVTDGEDVEGAGADRYSAISARLREHKIRLDVVLTEGGEKDWTGWLAASGTDLHVWRSANFDDLIETLDRAIADGDQEWVLAQSTSVPGVGPGLPRLLRTAMRNDPSVSQALRAQTLTAVPRTYPLLARRQLVGRTASLSTDSWGDTAMAAFWADAAFQAEINGALGFLLTNAGAVTLVLNPLDDGAELVWTGEAAVPTGDLETSAGIARMDSPGRWLLEAWPTGEELKVFRAGSLLQRIALPQLVPAELRFTGDDEVFFAVAAEGGIRVFHSLDSWQPRRFVESAEKPLDVTWAAALAGMLAVLAGFALRRR